MLQSYVADSQQRGLGAKYIRNIISTMSAMWDVAVSWGYIAHKPFASLILPACDRSDVEPYSEEGVIKIFRAAREPFKTFLWILGEAGMRPGEVCALDARYIHLEDRVISVSLKAWELSSARKLRRVTAISPFRRSSQNTCTHFCTEGMKGCCSCRALAGRGANRRSLKKG
jgi:integrase